MSEHDRHIAQQGADTLEACLSRELTDRETDTLALRIAQSDDARAEAEAGIRDADKLAEIARRIVVTSSTPLVTATITTAD